MKRSIGEGRHKMFSVYCSEEDLKRIKDHWRKTICRSLSEYARKVLMEKPVAVTTRNLSLDSLIEQLIGLRNDFEKLTGKSGFWARDRHRLLSALQEIKVILNKIVDECILE